uniref:Uncharacterized protein n=1 Tax=Ixodes ricinus TaxID=34613 RepID=A0A6B0UQ49_IXORI
MSLSLLRRLIIPLSSCPSSSQLLAFPSTVPSPEHFNLFYPSPSLSLVPVSFHIPLSSLPTLLFLFSLSLLFTPLVPSYGGDQHEQDRFHKNYKVYFTFNTFARTSNTGNLINGLFTLKNICFSFF